MRNIFALILVIISSISGVAQKKADLTLNLEPNQVYRLKSVTVQNTIQTVMGNEQSVQTNNTTVFSIKPLKIMEGEMINEVRFDTIISVINQPPMEFSSVNPGDLSSEDPAMILGCIMNRMSNSTFLVKMSNNGKVIQFMNLEPVKGEIMKGTDTIQGQMAGFILSRAEGMLEEKALAGMIESATAFLPGKEVKIGDSWEVGLNLSGGGMNFIQNSVYKLESIDKKSAKISGEQVLETAPGTLEMSGAQITPDIRGLGKSELTIDPETGWIIKGTIKQQLKGEITVNAQGNTLTIPMEMKNESEIISIQ